MTVKRRQAKSYPVQFGAKLNVASKHAAELVKGLRCRPLQVYFQRKTVFAEQQLGPQCDNRQLTVDEMGMSARSNGHIQLKPTRAIFLKILHFKCVRDEAYKSRHGLECVSQRARVGDDILKDAGGAKWQSFCVMNAKGGVPRFPRSRFDELDEI